MELNQVITERRSIRNFSNEPVSIEDIKAIITAGTMAPSINNSQPWRFIGIKNKQLLGQLADAVSETLMSLKTKDGEEAERIFSKVHWYSTFFKEAPVVVAVVLKNYQSVLEKAVDMNHKELNELRNYPDIQSIGACIQNMLLTATDLGYGSCWLSAPSLASKQLEQILEIGTDAKIIAFVALGRPISAPKPPEKKPIDEIFEMKF